MSTRGWDERVKDILDAIDEIDMFTAGMERETFQVDFKTVRAAELNLIIIGEAASGIPDDIQEKQLDIPWSFMKAMRNRLVHAYPYLPALSQAQTFVIIPACGHTAAATTRSRPPTARQPR